MHGGLIAGMEYQLVISALYPVTVLRRAMAIPPSHRRPLFFFSPGWGGWEAVVILNLLAGADPPAPGSSERTEAGGGKKVQWCRVLFHYYEH